MKFHFWIILFPWTASNPSWLWSRLSRIFPDLPPEVWVNFWVSLIIIITVHSQCSHFVGSSSLQGGSQTSLSWSPIVWQFHPFFLRLPRMLCHILVSCFTHCLEALLLSRLTPLILVPVQCWNSSWKVGSVFGFSSQTLTSANSRYRVFNCMGAACRLFCFPALPLRHWGTSCTLSTNYRPLTQAVQQSTNPWSCHQQWHLLAFSAKLLADIVYISPVIVTLLLMLYHAHLSLLFP